MLVLEDGVGRGMDGVAEGTTIMCGRGAKAGEA